MTEVKTPKAVFVKRRDVVGPIILIVVGIVLLLQQFEILPWGIWQTLWRFWPVLLILSGMQIFLGQRHRSQVVIGLISLLMFACLMIYALDRTQTINLPKFFDIQPALHKRIQTKTTQITPSQYNLDEIQSLEYHFSLGAAKLELSDQAPGNNILSLRSTLPESHLPEVTHEMRDQTLDIKIEVAKQSWLGFNSESQLRAQTYANDIPANYYIEVGAGSANLTLSKSQLKSLNISVGAGSAMLDFSQMSTPSAEVKIEVGVGSAKITLPPEAAFTLDYQVGVGKILHNGSAIDTGFGNQGTYQASQVATPGNTPLHLKLDIGTGSVEIVNK